MSPSFESHSVIPLVLLSDQRTWIHRYIRPNSLLVPFYDVWGDSNTRAIASRHRDIHDLLGFRGPIGLSSIGPDDYVVSEAYFSDFVRFSTESNFDYVVAWDMPTYADWPSDISFKNTMWKIYQEYKEKKLTKEDIKEIKGRSRSLQSNVILL